MKSEFSVLPESCLIEFPIFSNNMQHLGAAFVILDTKSNTAFLDALTNGNRSQRASIAHNRIKLLLETPASHQRVPVQVLSALFLFQLPANTPGKPMRDGPSISPPDTHLQITDVVVALGFNLA